MGDVEAGPGTARLVDLQVSADPRGSLSAATFGLQIPFVPKRMFIVHGTPEETDRGGHAHLECHQLLVAAAGSVTVTWHDGVSEGSVTLAEPTVALHLPPLVWGAQRYHQSGSVLVVLASHEYDRSDYLETFDAFLDAHRKRRSEVRPLDYGQSAVSKIDPT